MWLVLKLPRAQVLAMFLFPVISSESEISLVYDSAKDSSLSFGMTIEKPMTAPNSRSRPK